MSHRATDWAWTTPARGVELFVLLALADYADKKRNDCYPSLPELAEKTGLGTSTVRRSLRQLEADGLIKVDISTGGRRLRSTYTLDVGAVHSRDETQPQRAGNDGVKTQSQRVGKDLDTQPERAGYETETQPQRAGNPTTVARNPTRAGGVVLRTKTSHEPVIEPTTGEAAASPRSNGSLVLLPDLRPVPALQSVNGGHLANVWIDTYRATHPGSTETNRQKLQAAREAKGLLEAGNDPARVQAAVESAAEKGFSTVEREFTMMSSRNGQRRPRSTTDERVAQGHAIVDLYPEEPA